MSVRQLHQNTDYFLALAPVAATSANQTSNSWDMTGFDGCEVTAIIGTAAAGGIAVLNYQIGASTTSFSGTTGGTCTTTAAGSDGLLVIDSYKPTKRYGRATLTNATTANIEIGGILVRRYHTRSVPTTATSSGSLLAAKVFLTGATTT